MSLSYNKRRVELLIAVIEQLNTLACTFRTRSGVVPKDEEKVAALVDSCIALCNETAVLLVATPKEATRVALQSIEEETQ